jgi:hypothetical protein
VAVTHRVLDDQKREEAALAFEQARVDAIPLGTNFSKVLHEEVAKCGVLLAVIGPNWLDARDEHGNRRLDNPNDFVRIEIAAALQRSIPVIPLLLDGARIPKADELPEDLKELALRNGMEVRHASFQDDMNRLIRGLKEDGVYLAGGDTSEFPTKTDAAKNQLKGTDGLWEFLRDKSNQQVLGWLGGGLAETDDKTDAKLGLCDVRRFGNHRQRHQKLPARSRADINGHYRQLCGPDRCWGILGRT